MNAYRTADNGRTSSGPSRSRSRDKRGDHEGPQGVKVKLELIEKNKHGQKIPAKESTLNKEVISISLTEETHEVDKGEEIVLASGSEDESSTEDMDIEAKEGSQKSEEDSNEEGVEEADDQSTESEQGEEEDVKMVIAPPGPKKTTSPTRKRTVDFAADDSDNEDEERQIDEDGDVLEQEEEHDVNKVKKEEYEKRLYAAWNNISERALVRVEGKWYDIYDTDLLSPLPSPTKKFMKDFNQRKNEQVKPSKSTKTTKKAGRSGLALNFYGSPGGKGYVNNTDNKEEGKNNQNLAPITPEKPSTESNQTIERLIKPRKQIKRQKKLKKKKI